MKSVHSEHFLNSHWGSLGKYVCNIRQELLKWQFMFSEEAIHVVLDCISKHQLVGLEDLNLSADEIMLLEFCCGLKSEATDNLWETMQDYASKEGIFC